MLGTNGAGIGTSSIAVYDKRLTAYEMGLPEREHVDKQMDALYELMEDETGGFLDCDGSGLFHLQSSCNHACRPSAEATFPDKCSALTLVALSAIAIGHEVTISYIDVDLGEGGWSTWERGVGVLGRGGVGVLGVLGLGL